MRIEGISFAGDRGQTSPPGWLLAGPQAGVPTAGNPPGARVATLRLAAPLPAGGLRLALRGGFELSVTDAAGPAPPGAPALDHVTLCVDAGNLGRYAALLAAQLPGARSERHRVGAPADGMDIIALSHAASGVHVVLAAPTGPGGQVAEFLDAAGCEGLQHVAFAVTALAPALAALEARGLRFVGGPGAAAVIELREGEHWLRQVFTEPVWGGFFVELVERHGVTGLHASNIRAMYAAKGLEPAAVAPPAVSAAPALPASG
jgi:4-hydroxyphenylpyruvate dioxygenase-like putative hemolysin